MADARVPISRASIPEDQLRELYLVQKLTMEQVAVRFGATATTIARRLRDLGIPARRRGPVPGSRSSPLPEPEYAWTPELAYAVGMIATDGCLSRDRRHLTVSSKDAELLVTVKECLGVIASIKPAHDSACYRLQWGDAVMWQWLCDIGLMPAKSLRLGPLRVPDACFVDFFRGCVDGDGSIVTYVDRYNIFKNSRYVYRPLYLSLVSASHAFITWVRRSVERLVGASGDLSVRHYENASDVWCLRYAKRESLILLRWIYYADDVPCLRRKREIAAPFLVRERPPVRRGVGRPMVI